MEMVDQHPAIDYYDSQERQIIVADVLSDLREQLAAQRTMFANVKRAIQQLEVAIAAIERDEAESKKQLEPQRTGSRRGYLSKAVLDAIRIGIGTASTITGHLGHNGIAVSQPSVSNAIGRLQRSGQIVWDLKLRRWILASNSGSSEEDQANKVSASDGTSEAGNGAVVVSMGAHSR